MKLGGRKKGRHEADTRPAWFQAILEHGQKAWKGVQRGGVERSARKMVLGSTLSEFEERRKGKVSRSHTYDAGVKRKVSPSVTEMTNIGIDRISARAVWVY